jgi:hypothetical protein
MPRQRRAGARASRTDTACPLQTGQIGWVAKATTRERTRSGGRNMYSVSKHVVADISRHVGIKKATAVLTVILLAPASLTAFAPAPSALAIGIAGPNESNFIVAIGLAHGLNTYWNAAGSSSWHFQHPVGRNSIYALSQLSESAGSNEIAYEGWGHSLIYRWNSYGSSTWNRDPIAPYNSAYSSPSVIDGNGVTQVAVEGPDHSLDLYWANDGSSQWNKQVVAGTGTTYSSPSLSYANFNAQAISSTLEDIAVEGPDHELIDYEELVGETSWSATYTSTPGAAYSGPSLIEAGCDTFSPGLCLQYFDIAVQGPDNTLVDYHQDDNNNWGSSTVAGDGTTEQAPRISYGNGNVHIATQGADHALDYYWLDGSTWTEQSIPGANLAYGSPSIDDANGSTDIAVQGPKGSIYFYYETYGDNWSEPTEIAGSGSILT